MAEQRYLVAARKYRPQRFAEVVSQEHVSETLMNAIRLDRLAHAYLFSGPRGVGKTTAARILAKAINCTTPPEERTGEAEPCRACASCQSFEEGRSLNIIEIDAASNNKVEDIRELRDTVRVPPQGSRKKVYIVDEVHMLSNAAFNALLKTLEEPPPYVLFIFATTEPNKVLPTILSRCQRFDFRRIPVPEIVAHLQHICETEGITADEASLLLLARKGDGALRDALSAFDQAVSLCGTDLRYDELAQALGVVDLDLFFEVTAHVLARSGAGMLHIVDRIVQAGYDLEEFVVGLAEHLRNLLVARTLPTPELIEATAAVRARYAETATAFEETDLLRLLLLADEAEDALKGSIQPRLKLEMALLKMAALHRTIDLRQALEKLSTLERLAQEGKLPVAPSAPGTPASPPRTPEAPMAAPMAAAMATPPAPAPSPEPRVPEPLHTEDVSRAHPVVEEPPPPAPRAEPRLETPPEEASPEETPSEEPPSEAPRSNPTPAITEAQEADHEVSAPVDPAPASPPVPVPPAAPPPPAPDLLPSLFSRPALPKKSDGGDGAPAAHHAGADLTEDPVAVAEPTLTGPLHQIQQRWAGFVKQVRAERVHVGGMLDGVAAPLDVSHGTLRVQVLEDFSRKLLADQADWLLPRLNAIIELDLERLVFVLQSKASTPTQAAENTGPLDPQTWLQRTRESDPGLAALLDRFGGEMAW